mmetsp:Transcript_30720/g.69301  ORF Transcript_30720/g.69301 Transcript_30720/m.69301 type:complete len:130 (-) Transcript_30720:188-577(-)
MLKTILDNTASTFTTVTIKCQVCLETLSQIEKLNDFNHRQELQNALKQSMRNLNQVAERTQDLYADKEDLQAGLQQLAEEMQRMQAELNEKEMQIVDAEGLHAQISHTVDDLWKQLNGTDEAEAAPAQP